MHPSAHRVQSQESQCHGSTLYITPHIDSLTCYTIVIFNFPIMMSLSLMASRMCMYQESEPFLRRIAPRLLTGIHAWKVSPLLTLEDKLRSRIGGRNIALHSSNASSFN